MQDDKVEGAGGLFALRERRGLLSHAPAALCPPHLCQATSHTTL